MTESELAFGLTRAAAGLGRTLQKFEESLDELARHLASSTLDAVEAALPRLVGTSGEWHAARQWAEFYRRMGQDRIGFLEDQACGRRWYDSVTLGLTGLVRRHQLGVRVRRYRDALARSEPVLSELGVREAAALDRVRELQQRVEDARRAEEARQAEEARRRLQDVLGATAEPNKSGTLARVWDGIKVLGPAVRRHKGTLTKVAFVLVCVALGLPPDPASLLSAALA